MHLPDWTPDQAPIYDIRRSYAENAAHGPFFNGEIPRRPFPHKAFPFLGTEVLSPIGIPAGPLLNSNWVALAAKLGFDILTYKTIRSDAHPSHSLPNIAFVDPRGNQTVPPNNLLDLTITNSFGMPSKSPDFLLQDIAKANGSLSAGQVLIVSVAGTPNRGLSFLDDFVRVAKFAKEAGAKIIEANFSCPNVKKTHGILYQSPETVHEYAEAIAKAIKPIPLILKMGTFENEHLLKSVFLAAAKAGARGICGINTLNMSIEPPLDEKRKTSGVCGSAIREKALAFIRSASKVIRDEKLDLTLLGCGGIVLPEHFDLFFEAGADVAMSATGMMWDPYLAMRYYEITHSSTL